VQQEQQQSYNIILSPTLYWVQKLSLPMKYVREVKKLLPSLFEDILPEGNYSYFAYKHDEQFIAFAYDDRAILSLLETKGIHAPSVAKVYFAQSLFDNISYALHIDTQSALIKKEGIWTQLPLTWVKEPQTISLENLELKHPVTLSSFTHIIDPKIFTRMSAIVLTFALLFFGEAFFMQQQTEHLLEQKSTLFEEYHLKATSMQNNALMKKYLSLHEKQTKLRQITAQLLSLKLPAQSSLTYIALKGKTLVATFNTKNSKEIFTLLRSLNLEYTTKEQTNKLTIEVVL
jgi:hypothetical protein